MGVLGMIVPALRPVARFSLLSMPHPASSLPPVASIPWGWRSVFAAVRWLWWAFWAGVLLLLLSWAFLFFYLAPHIDQYQGQLERMASLKLGRTLRIDSVRASRDALPQLDIRGLRVYDQQGRVALALPQVQVQLTPLSLLRLRAERVVVLTPDLVLRRDAQGRIFVGGLDWGQGESGDTDAFVDGFFSLAQFEVRGGNMLWIDEKRQAPALALHDVQIGVRNAWGRHQFYVAATPPPAWGERLSVQADLRGAWLDRQPGAWRTWQGVIYADLPMANAAHLGQYLDGQLQLLRGAGALRSWAEFDRGEIRSVALDVALARVALRLQPDLPELDLQDLQGCLLLARQQHALQVLLKDGQFTTADGQQWPAGQLQLELQGDWAQPQAGQLRAEHLSLPILAKIAESLPMATRLRHHLQQLAPQGDIAQLQLAWQGDISAPKNYRAQGQITGLALAAQAEKQVSEPLNFIAPQAGFSGQTPDNILKSIASIPTIGQPGLAGVNIQFDVQQDGGKASLSLQNGWLEFPGVFQEPRIPVDKLSADAHWQFKGEAIAVQLDKVQFANADVQGSAQARWHTSAGQGDARFPGVLDLQGQFDHAQAGRVWRYLPLTVNQDARNYVQQAVQGGVGSRGEFQVRGNLLDIPSKDPKISTFRIAAHLDQGYYQFAPTALASAGSLPWPALKDLQGELVFDGYSMRVSKAQGLLGQVRIPEVQAELADWDELRVNLHGKVQDDLGRMLDTMRGSGLGALLGQSLGQAQGSGTAQLDLHLDLPIQQLAQSKASGQLKLEGNQLRWLPSLPPIEALHGVVRFDENGLVLQDIQGRILGGALQAQGGMGALAGRKDAGLHLQLQGQLNSQGLRAQTGLPEAWTALGQHLQGSSPYRLQIDAQPSSVALTLDSSLQGMAVHLPSPLAKDAASTQALHINWKSADAGKGAAPTQRLQANWGQAVAAQYEVQAPSGAVPPVVRGLLALGSLPANARLPDAGVQLLVQADVLDAGDWYARLANVLDSSAKMASTQSVLKAYLPQRVALRVGRLQLGDRALHSVQAQVERSGSDGWKISGQAQELAGQMEYHNGAAGQSDNLRARLQRLDWTEAQAAQMNEGLLHAPSSMPALDVLVEDFRLRGKALGRLEINANNYGAATDANREWRLNKLAISSPEAQFSSTGAWLAGQNRTVLNFNWALQDAGKLLDRFGQKEVLAKGKGNIEGQISWQGAITAPDTPSMNGKLQVHVQDGRFLKADPGAAKLLGVLNLQALPRRLNLDFRDVFAQGFAFDFVRGDMQIQKGLASTNNLQIKGVNAAVLMEGVADLKEETQDLHVVVVPEINAGTAALVATAINPAVGLGAFVAQWLLGKPVAKAATQHLRITGSWTDPKVEKIEK